MFLQSCHVLTGFDTTLTGEVELAAWELGSGGCGWNALFWIDRVFAVLLGAFVAPRRLGRAFGRGLGQCNLYGLRSADVLSMDFAEAQARLKVTGLGL